MPTYFLNGQVCPLRGRPHLEHICTHVLRAGFARAGAGAAGPAAAAVQTAAQRQPGATSARAEVHSRTSRTDRGVHALANVAHLKISTQFKAGSSASPALLRM